MSAIAKLIKAGAAAGAAGLGIGALVYEGALNTSIATKFGEFFNKRDKDRIEQRSNDYAASANEWFEQHKGEDHVIACEKAGKAHAYIILNENPSDKWAVLNHGYSSDPSGTAAYAREYYNMGYNCICPSMRGLGKDENRFCSMGYYDKYICLAWVNYIALTYPDAKILIHGYSMGAATTMLTLGEDIPANVKCAVSDCGYTNCYEQYTYVLKHNASIPAFPLLDLANAVSKMSGNFDFKAVSPIDVIKKTDIPILFIHGDKDAFVPYFMMDKLYDACASEKEKLTVEGAVHASSIFKDPELYWETVKKFIAKYM